MKYKAVAMLMALSGPQVMTIASDVHDQHEFSLLVSEVGRVEEDPHGRIYLLDGKRIPFAFSIDTKKDANGDASAADNSNCSRLHFRIVVPSSIEAMGCSFVVDRPFYAMSIELSMADAAAIEQRSVEYVREEALVRLKKLREGDRGFVPELDRLGDEAIDEYLSRSNCPVIGVDCSYAARMCRSVFESYRIPMAIPTLSQWLIIAGSGKKSIIDAIPITPQGVVWGTEVTKCPEQMLKFVRPACDSQSGTLEINNIFGNVSEYVVLSQSEKDSLSVALRQRFGGDTHRSLFYENKIASTVGLSMGGDVMAGAGWETRAEAWAEFRKEENWNARYITGFRRVEGGSVMWDERIVATGFRPVVLCPMGAFSVVQGKNE